MSSVPVEALLGRKKSLAGSLWGQHCYLKDPAEQGGRVLICINGLVVGLLGSHHRAQIKIVGFPVTGR